MKRLQYTPPWKVTNWGFGFPFFDRGCDQYHNLSWLFIVPLFGSLTIFHQSLLDDSGWFYIGNSGNFVLYANDQYTAFVREEDAANLPGKWCMCEDDINWPWVTDNESIAWTAVTIDQNEE